MSELTVVEDAQVAYEGYRTFMGNVLRPWPEMDEPSREAWRAAAHAVREIMFCPPHWHMEHTAAMEPFTQCIACMREEVRELRERRDFLLESNNRLVEERRAAEADVERLRTALKALMRQQSTVEVLGEYSALDINHGSQRKMRASVESVMDICHAALSALGGIPDANR